MGGIAIVAIAGDETAEAANTIAHRDRRSGQVKHSQTADLRLPPLPQEHCDASQESTEPGKARPVKKDQQRLVDEQRRIFEYMP